MNNEILLPELQYTTSRSSGPGGQHANKVSSRVQLLFDLGNSKAFSAEEKERLLKKLKPKLTKENILILSSEESRSQHQNKEIVTKKFLGILKEALKIPKKRKRTKPTKASVQERLEKKKRQALKKAQRRKPL